MKTLLIGVLVVAGLVILDRLLLKAEERGWIYWRKKRASPGTRASAALELQSLLEPNRKHVVESVRHEEEEEDDSGEPV